MDDLIQKMENTKNQGLTNLDKSIQPLIAATIKKYKKLQNLTDELTKQKTYVVGQYQLDFDEYMNNNLQNRYNRDQYIALKSEVNAFKAKYYASVSQLNCSNILSTSDDGTSLLAKIATMNTAVGS